MNKNFTLLLAVVAIISAQSISAQSNNLSGSPYSLFGLGTANYTNSGLSTGTSLSGTAWNSAYFYNGINPATLSSLQDKIFIMDIGLKTELNKISNNDTSESVSVSNFSNLSFATKTGQRSGVSLSLTPSSTVGYSLTGQVDNIEGSTEEYITSVSGSGGINELNLSYGYKLTDKLNLGFGMQYLFGSIKQEESIETWEASIDIDETNYYSGIGLRLGATYQLTKNLTFGALTDLQTTMNGRMDRTITKSKYGVSSEVESEEGTQIDDFTLPWRMGFGLNYSFLKKFVVDIDYNKRFWSVTDQTDDIGTYKDQSIYNFSFKYFNAQPRNYLESVILLAGFNYDTGYLEIDHKSISNTSATFGIGIPIGGRSILNINYTHGLSGESGNLLIQENYNTININLNLTDLWFQKRWIN
ncbi:OmpP1/FadL family transporter [Robertkochia solimangrovi]|uniref:OmpP1/FadL family transporter n=1 Tax=Robertkochia solimangrovi TaxID=2213046 RepID=UPI00117E8568|nr:outer membrane beta-barrel protein [Robertkochia solimangrovi]TRZ41865.1 hypothetical protein DMZ48_16100 [Robertkochia solimangrovi]